MSKYITLFTFITCISVLGQTSESERKASEIPYNESLSDEEFRTNTLTSYSYRNLNNELRRDLDSLNSPNKLKEALEKLCSAISTSNQEVLKEFSGLSPEVILEGFTFETMPEDGPHCTNWNINNDLNFLRSNTEYYMYAIEYGEGSGYLMLVYEGDRWIANKFVFNEEVEKLRNESKGE